MPDEQQMWDCGNCSSNWNIDCTTNQHHLENRLILKIIHFYKDNETIKSERVFQFKDFNNMFEELKNE
jgi:hypothetical protein